MRRSLPPILALPLALLSCSFDYGDLSDSPAASTPDLVMSGVEYVRVRDGKPVVRLRAESVERYEKERRMVASAARFSQYDGDGAEGAVGDAASAVVDLASGDVDLSGSVTLSVPREELSIETELLSWKDGDRLLSGGSEVPVLIRRADGSRLSGSGFEADARSRRWSLSGGAAGILVEEDADDGSSGEAAP